MAAGWFDNVRRLLGWISAAPQTTEQQTAISYKTRYNATERTTFARARHRTTIAEAKERGET